MDSTNGIQTILMTDVVGSTRLWSAYPRSMPGAVERIEAMAEIAVEDEGGRVVKRRGEGDSLFCVMPHPSGAARAAIALVRALAEEPWPEGLSISVRSAIHCGPAHVRGEDLFGPVPDRCARLREVAHGGQILLSGVARSHVGPADGVGLRELGRHRLRDLDEPEAVWQVGEEDHPPLRSLSLLRNNLPVQLTTFVGREALRRTLRARVAEDRLTTLTGVGGGGKTRLALQVGADAAAEFPGGVWFVDLADVASDAGVARALARVCGHGDLPEAGLLDALAGRLRGAGRVLFVVDNAEHLIAETGAAVTSLLSGAPDAACLVTSREPLRLRGERVHRVPPLELPPLGCDDPSTVERTESGALFLDRARLADPEFAFDRRGAEATGRILRRVDGIPLCVEMVAAHVPYLAPAEIALRLEDRFALLEDEGADVPARHRTMRETLAWQVDSLAPDERLLLARLALFAGFLDLEAAEAVGGAAPLAPAAVVRRLRGLVDKSLVVAVRDGEHTAYRLLEVVEGFAAPLLAQDDAARPAFLAWAATAAETGHARLYGENHDEAVSRLDRTYPSLRRALDRAVEEDCAQAARLALGLARYWMYRGLYTEGSVCARRAEAVCAGADLAARLANAVGVFADRSGDTETAEAAYRRALASGAVPAMKLGARVNLAILMNGQGRLDEAVGLYRDAIEAAAAAGDGYTRRLAEFNLGQAYLDLGRLAEGEAALLAAAEAFRAAGDLTRVAHCHVALSGARCEAGDARAAGRHLAAARAALSPNPDHGLLAALLLDAACLADGAGQVEDAARLLAAHDARCDAHGGKVEARSAARRDSVAARVRASLPDEGASQRAQGHTAEVPALLAWVDGVLATSQEL